MVDFGVEGGFLGRVCDVSDPCFDGHGGQRAMCSARLKEDGYPTSRSYIQQVSQFSAQKVRGRLLKIEHMTFHTNKAEAAGVR